jgi:hypothetical protein
MSPTPIPLKRTLVGRRMPLSELEGELLPKQTIADTLGVSAVARVPGSPPIITSGASTSMLDVEMPNTRFHAVDLPGGGRIVVDAGRRISREQQQLVNALPRMLDASDRRASS